MIFSFALISIPRGFTEQWFYVFLGIRLLQKFFALISFVQNFGAPSFDDKKLEVVAVFGSMQMAVSRVINLQHHRIAQVKIPSCLHLQAQSIPIYQFYSIFFPLS